MRGLDPSFQLVWEEVLWLDFLVGLEGRRPLLSDLDAVFHPGNAIEAPGSSDGAVHSPGKFLLEMWVTNGVGGWMRRRR